MKNETPSGLVLLHKKPGLTSFEALKPLKDFYKSGKIGHTGTLDKFAEGLLIVLTGRALRLSPWFTRCDKRYEALIRFGEETDTLDPEGEVIAREEAPSREAFEAALPRFTGTIEQTPPVYSAIHVEGERASALARSGKTPEMKKRRISVYSLELLSWEAPFARIGVRCSSGTYVRSLARDLARAAGSRGHLAALLRTAIGNFTLAGAWTGEGDPALRPLDSALFGNLGIPSLNLDGSTLDYLAQGRDLSRLPGFPPADLAGGCVAVFCGKVFACLIVKNGETWRYGFVYARPGEGNDAHP